MEVLVDGEGYSRRYICALLVVGTGSAALHVSSEGLLVTATLGKTLILVHTQNIVQIEHC